MGLQYQPSGTGTCALIALMDFAGGVAAGEDLYGWLDWAAILIGFALLLSTFRGLRRGRIVGPVLRAAIGVVLMGWAIA
jgi:hypothetical protein